MSKQIELHLIDSGAGEAILKIDQGWYLISMDYGWRPAELGSIGAVVRWSHAGNPRFNIKEYFSIEEAVRDVRQACLGGLEVSDFDRYEVHRLIAKLDIRELLEEDDQGLSEDLPEWVKSEEGSREGLFRQYCGRLDRLLLRLGFSKEESLNLAAEILDELSEEIGSFNTRRSFEIRMFKLAYESQQERKPGVSPPHRLGRGHESEGTLQILRKLPPEALGCLALWSEANLEISDIRIVMRISASAVVENLSKAAILLHCTLEDLQTPLLNHSCRILLQ